MFLFTDRGACANGLALISSEISFSSKPGSPPVTNPGPESSGAGQASQAMPTRTPRDSGPKTYLAGQKRLVKRDAEAGVSVGPKVSEIPSRACEEGGNLQRDLLEDMAPRAVELIRNMGVPAYAMVVQCQEGPEVSNLIRESAKAGVPLCMFASLSELTKGAMTLPDHALCFANREWTVVLVGSSLWGAGLVATAKATGLYEARVHWVLMVTGAASEISQSLPLFSVHHRVTWLKWSAKIKAWAVLASEVGERGLVARQAGRWAGRGREGRLEASRPLKPRYTNDFFGATLRVVSRRDTDKVRTFNTVARCFYTEDGGTSCLGYEADIALGTCSITYDRVRMVDFTEFFNGIRSSLMSAEPNVAEAPFLIFNVLSWQAWACVGVFALLSVLALWAVTRALSDLPGHALGPSPSLRARGEGCSPASRITSSLRPPAHHKQPSTVSGRAVAGVSWLVVISLAAVYSGNLTAWLSLPRYEIPVNSLEDLANRPDLVPLVRRNDPNHQMFINKTDGTLGAIAERLVLINSTTNEDIRKVVHGKYVYMNSDRSHLRTATLLNMDEGFLGFAPCRIYIGNQDVRQDYLGLMINKNSWFKEQMNRKLRWLRSYGVVTKLYRQYNPPGCRLDKPGRRSSVKERLSLSQLQGIFWVWLVGMGVAFLTLLAEVLVASLAG
ncbi:Glutamate receptor [Penaeus vannamei]|uniref:Glutamate receptor n=1 Tax=Penaeus vannamei TaxID=6689 RepID=A0A423TTY7_PENVA|nr:Glutamate receptor [Penaeus vannamei]